MGGDEFIVVTTHAEDRVAVEQLAQRIRTAIGASSRSRARRSTYASASASASIPTMASSRGADKYADIALYQAKAAGRNNYQFFAADMSQTVEERIFLEQSLARAVGTPQLYVQYQALVDLPSGRVIGFEALTRWRHPERGLVSPVAFIPIAEQSGLINAVGRAAAAHGVRPAARLAGRGSAARTVAINVSPRQFEHGHLPEHCSRHAGVRDRAGTPPDRADRERADEIHRRPRQHAAGPARRRRARRDRRLRHRLLEPQLPKHLPIDSLKIDRSFIRDMVNDPRDAAIVRP